MSGFVLVERKYDKVPSVLRQIPGFSDSLEYERLGDDLQETPGLVCAAFSQFFERFQRAEAEQGLTDRDSETLAAAYRVLEEIASSDDTDVQNLVEMEFFENLNFEQPLWQLVEDRLGPNSRSLLSDWRRRNAVNRPS
jgi:hypothetical protein